MTDVLIAGAGIVGLATAYELSRRGHSVTALDKEPEVAAHQTGHNSGVIHSGLYYAPGSLKATLGVRGAESMRDFAQEHGVAVDICGKLVVATTQAQVPALLRLLDRGRANGVPVRLISPEEAREFEPHVACVAALRVDTTGIVDFRGVCAALARLIGQNGGQVRLGTEIVGIDGRFDGVTVTTTAGEFTAAQFVNCAGLHSDRLARLAGLDPAVRIIPFRGEYFELAAAQEYLVTGLIYPVPDPTLPFLGVHLTRMIAGGVHAGPNAVLALAREGYTWGAVDRHDVSDSLAWPGLWRLGRRYWRTGISEVARSVSDKRFLASLRELVPELPDGCLRPSHAGVRAQALHRDGRLVDDFYYERGIRQVHVLNAPSPAATASLEIGRRIADEVEAPW
ncbi:L-2-hydroxyglutarate oxidase [Nakamurella multipartita]|uniref:FAD dependent oxidoreductase n=1 Tax=Nakamurella multipartita (strain ATCC 700099 / DSM 44233 / CIP 104796 / JCM 9543 / NBRC 105858 / Y-104) TaxID=479431 RepID=C8X6X1_NAKMY|nr:L-2-hydroxyglutarate oxidase [Nakamurella multipartita]ACV80869.1 FAD dependent oxidoreductase [Nakamurella multipartita DSM 44233]